MEQIILVNETRLANKELVMEMNTIKSALEAGNKATWEVCEALVRILEGKLYEEDFEDEKDFAEYCGISKGALSQYKGAMRFRRATGDTSLTMYCAYILSGFVKEVEDNDGAVYEVGYDVSALTDFLVWCDGEKIDIHKLSQKALVNIIKEYKNKDNVVEETSDSVEEETSDSVEEETSDSVEDVEDELIYFTIEDKTYAIPNSILARYEVTNN